MDEERKEEKILTIEEAVCFLQVLETENEERLAKITQEIQAAGQRIREIDYSLQELEIRQDSNVNFFSPVGVYKEGEEKKNLFRETEELKEGLSLQQEKLAQYGHRKKQLQYLKNTIRRHALEMQEHDRNRIAMELYDSSMQNLTDLAHRTEFCVKLLDVDRMRAKLELQTMIEAMKTMINEMREKEGKNG